MIKWAGLNERSVIEKICVGDPVTGCRIMTLLNAYGDDMNIARFWLGGPTEGQPAFVMCLFASTVYIASISYFNIEELCKFIEMLGAKAIETAYGLSLELFRYTGGRFFASDVLKYINQYDERELRLKAESKESMAKDAFNILYKYSIPAPNEQRFYIDTNPSLSLVYELLCEVKPSIRASCLHDAWLADISHRVRHKHARIYGIKSQSDKIISTAGAYYISKRAAIIESVATSPNERSKRYASRLLAKLCEELSAEGREIFILSADPYPTMIYCGIGFAQFTKQGNIIL